MASIQVTVQYPPEINASESSHTSKSWNGSRINLQCFSTGLPAPQISWYKPTNQQITTGVNIIPGGSEVTVLTTADQGDYGQYKCRATNILGSEEYFINVIQLFPPGAVTITLTNVGASSVTVSWTKPANEGGSPVTDYKVEINSSKASVNKVNDHAVIITELEQNTRYLVNVSAKNVVGYGNTSSKAFSTLKQGPPSVPQLTATVDNRSILSVILRWMKPDDNGGEITQYTIYMKKQGDSEWTKVDDVTNPATLEYNITKHIEYREIYKCIVTAWNKYGESIKDDVLSKTISIPQVNPTSKTNTTGSSTFKYDSTSGRNSKYLIGIGVLAVILVVSLALNMKQFLYIQKKIESNENGRDTEKPRANQREEDDQTYDNAIELRSTSSPVMESDWNGTTASAAPEYEAVNLPNTSRGQNPAKFTVSYEIPCKSGESSHYQELSCIASEQDHATPVYEPLRTGVPRNADETNTYQQLGQRNQSSNYQSIFTDRCDSMI